MIARKGKRKRKRNQYNDL